MTAPLPRPHPLQAGHPANHGFEKCFDCGCWRPAKDMAHVEGCPPRCFDVYGCKRLARREREESDARGLELVMLDAAFEAARRAASLTKPDQPGGAK